MSIRYKTALIFLTMGLLPFLVIGTLVFIDFQTALRASTFRNLEAVTTLQESRVIDLLTTYSQGTAYFAQQQPVRQAVQAYLANPQAAEPQLRQVLVGARYGGSTAPQSTPIDEVAITDVNGMVLDSSDPASVHKALPVKPGLLLTDMFGDQRGTHMLFSAPMVFNGKTLARFYLAVNAQPLAAIVSNRDGLGETGEIFLDKQIDDKTGVFVTPLRFDNSAAFRRTIPLESANRPSAQALLQKEKTFAAGTVSYRGQPVIAVTRYMPQAGLGIVGQMDQTEAFGPIHQLAVQVVVFAALLSMCSIFIGSLMSELFVKPILSLAGAAEKVRKGELSAHAKIWSKDEIGQLGHTFNSMADDLAKQDQEKSDIIALISHQLRTPVTAVKGFLSLIMQRKDRRLTAQDMEMLHLAFAENEKLNKLITQILEVAHADSGKLVVSAAPTDLVALAQDIAKESRSMLKLRQQTIKVTTPARPLVTAVDAAKIRFVLDILISNASKYSPDDTAIEIKLGKSPEHYWIQVIDKGLGISKADQPRLFQKFSRIHNPRSNTSEGVGLGLYMARKIIDSHKGNLTVSSSENRGSRFTIELPIKA